MQPESEAVSRVQPGESPAVVPKAEMPALRQVREAAKALLDEGQVEATVPASVAAALLRGIA